MTDFGTVLALSLLFINPNANFVRFVLVSIAVIVLVPRLAPWFFKRYGHRIIEPEIKLIFVALFALMYFAEVGAGHAVWHA